MYTFLSLTPEDFTEELRTGKSRIMSDERRLVVSREGIVYLPNYHTMERIANCYYKGESIDNEKSPTPKTLLTFHAIREEEFDYITDVNGKKVLKERSFCCIIFGNRPLIDIKLLGFNGTPRQLLRKHGMLYFSRGVNALRIEEDLTRRQRLNLACGT